MPPSINDFVPAGHIAHFVRYTVRETLDLSKIRGEYSEDRGFRRFLLGGFDNVRAD